MSKIEVSSNEPIAEFYGIVQAIIQNTQALQQYDTFAATAISSVINLMLSRDEEYVKVCNENQKNTLVIPQEVKTNVDSIVSAVKEKLDNSKKPQKKSSVQVDSLLKVEKTLDDLDKESKKK